MGETATASGLRDDLKAEYLQLQKNYEDFDGRILTIKSWGSLLTAGGLAVGYKEAAIGVLLVTIATALYLWFLEARWKTFQYCYTDRIRLLERYFRGEAQDLKPFQIFSSWGQAWEYQAKPAALANVATNSFVMIPYVPIIFLSICGIVIIWLWHPAAVSH
jgi:hypothetical protein